jgi:hypothetical protein
MAPAVYQFVPVLLPFDLVPHGLKKALAPKLAGKEGRGLRQGAAERARGRPGRAVEKTEEAAKTSLGIPATASLQRPRKRAGMSDARAKIRV